jgi:orotate phosphoribosyltransferase
MLSEKLKKQIKSLAIRKGEFTLSSGKKSTYYIDLKLAYTNPEIMMGIVSGMGKKLEGLKVDRIAGMELGAVPLAVALSMNTEIPFVIVRKERKGHGAIKRIEGMIIKGDNVILVEDVVTTGESLARTAEIIRGAGGKCTKAITIIDRLEGARENLQKINIALIPLLTIEDLGI